MLGPIVPTVAKLCLPKPYRRGRIRRSPTGCPELSNPSEACRHHGSTFAFREGGREGGRESVSLRECKAQEETMKKKKKERERERERK